MEKSTFKKTGIKAQMTLLRGENSSDVVGSAFPIYHFAPVALILLPEVNIHRLILTKKWSFK